jgi:hypothetical protein
MSFSPKQVGIIKTFIGLLEALDMRIIYTINLDIIAKEINQ